MKGIKYLLIGLVLGLVIGWAMGFLRLPYLEKNYSFLFGSIAALALVSLVLLLLRSWNRNLLLDFIGKKNRLEDAKNRRTHTYIWLVLMAVLIAAGLVAGVTVYRQNESFTLQIQNQEKQLREMATQLDEVKKNDFKSVMNSMLEDVAEELKHSPHRTLLDTTISRIADLSFVFKPYKYMDADSIEKEYSLERGQLLQALVLLNIDTGSFAQIRRKAHFAGAYLRGANLKGLDLSGINLSNANLKNADLSGANLNGADLAKVNFWGANLNRTKLNHTILRRADFRWAQLNEATLISANLDGVNLSNAQLNKTNLNKATLCWAQLGAALFNAANLTSVDFTGSNLTRTNFTEAYLNDTELRRTNLSETVLVGVSLDKALVDQRWWDKLNQSRVVGVKSLQERFSIVSDTIDIDKRPMFRMKPNNQ